MTPDEAVEAVKIIEELAAKEVIVAFSDGRWSVEISRRPSGEFVAFYGPTLLSALRAAKEGA